MYISPKIQADFYEGLKIKQNHKVMQKGGQLYLRLEKEEMERKPKWAVLYIPRPSPMQNAQS